MPESNQKEQIIQELAMALTHNEQGVYSANENYVREKIAQIETQALEEKIERINNLLETPAYNKDQTYDTAIREVLSILTEK